MPHQVKTRGMGLELPLQVISPVINELVPCRDISVLSLSTLDPYPGVAHPTILIPVGQDSALEMDIHGSHFVASTHPRFTFKYEGSIRVYNWETGTMLAVRADSLYSCEPVVMTVLSQEIIYPCDGFFLLTEELVVCYVTGRGPTDHFAIFRIPDTQNATPSVPPTLTSAPLCIFNLPHPTRGKKWYLNRGRTGSSYTSCPPPADSSVPFYSSGKRLLLSLWLLPSRGSWRNPDCSLVVPLRTLLNMIPSEKTRSTVVFDWDAWGPTGSRLLSGVGARQMSLQFGWKIARLGPPDSSTSPPGTSREVGITVYDFNPLPFHGHIDATESGEMIPQEFEAGGGERSRGVVTSPSPCPEFVGLDGVQTSLPYRVTSAPFEIRGRAADPVDYEISLGEDGMIVWTHVGSTAGHHGLPKDVLADDCTVLAHPRLRCSYYLVREVV